MPSSARIRDVSRLAVGLIAVLLLGPPAVAGDWGSDLAVHLGAPAAVAVPNEIRITATVSNLGPDHPSGLQLEVALSEGLVPMAVHQGPWDCAIAPAVTCFLGTLPAGTAAEVSVDAATVKPGALLSRATVIHPSPDPDPTNDTATAVVEVSGRPCDWVGTADADTLKVTRRGGVACGLRGDDVLVGARGRQHLFGGPGRDALGGGIGRDRHDGGPGRDACVLQGPRCEVRGLATASSLAVFEISHATVGYGYHQSLFRTAIGMRPLLPHRVMSSRGRGTGATTAVDVVVPSRARIRSPVTGIVVAVERYLLYCRTRDWKVVVAPRSHPRLRVLVLHMARPAVRDGDEVLAGSTLLGRAARNDQPSAQVNRYFPDRYPHIHVEVERNRASPTPGCDL